MGGFAIPLAAAGTSAVVGAGANKLFGNTPDPVAPGVIGDQPNPGVQQQQQFDFSQIGEQDLAALVMLLSQIAGNIPQQGGPQ